LHSATYKNAWAWAGRRVVVVGSSTTACDVALDCVRAQADIVMIQRGPTRIYPQAHIEAMQAPFWNSHMPVEVGDIISSEDPIVLQAALSKLMLGRMRDEYE
jgi:cation diffusion facilitator CzcD-associated flavoprotein CzcO